MEIDAYILVETKGYEGVGEEERDGEEEEKEKDNDLETANEPR